MGAAKDQGVDSLFFKPLEIGLCGQPGNFVIDPPFFSQRHEQRTGPGHHLYPGIDTLDRLGIGAAFDSSCRTDNPYLAAAGNGSGTPGARLYHPTMGMENSFFNAARDTQKRYCKQRPAF